MKVKLLTVLLLAATLSTIGISSATSMISHESIKEMPAATGAAVSTAPVNPLPQIPETVIDGSKNPEMIHDRVAYSLLFRFLSGRKTDEEKKRARSYLKMLFSCSDCADPAVLETNEAQINAVLAAAAEFEKRVEVFDHQAKAIKDRADAQIGKEDKIKLSKLQKRKEALVDEISASLPSHLGEEGTQKMRQFVKEHMKPKIKITPTPTGN
ncbi:MAG: hypothetical protein ACR2G4_04580 [Pyrinomonadaceae bacterium]